MVGIERVAGVLARVHRQLGALVEHAPAGLRSASSGCGPGSGGSGSSGSSASASVTGADGSARRQKSSHRFSARNPEAGPGAQPSGSAGRHVHPVADGAPRHPRSNTRTGGRVRRCIRGGRLGADRARAPGSRWSPRSSW
jgi:hypothetical protein